MRPEITQVNHAVVDVLYACGTEAKVSIYHMSDLHLDSPFCNRDMLAGDLAAAEEEGALVLIAGDVFDAMQTHNDPRRRLEELKAEYKVSNYLDAIVMDAIKFFTRFNLQYIIGLGNHETTIMTKLNTSLIDRLVFGINEAGGKAIAVGYEGYLRMLFRYKRGQDRRQKVTYFHHGNGGGAPVTRGVIKTNRQAVFLGAVADVVHNGHNHQGYTMPVPRAKLSNSGEPYTDIMWFIRTPGYKGGGMPCGETFGYGVERHPEPTPQGFVKIEYWYRKGHGVEITPIPKIRGICATI